MELQEILLMVWEHRNTHFFYGLMVYGTPLLLLIAVAEKIYLNVSNRIQHPMATPHDWDQLQP